MNAIFALAKVVIKELYRRKDFYVLFILTVLITLTMASANLFHDDRITGYLKEICLRLIWVSALVVAVGTAARQIPAERENRTIFPLLAKPVTRAHVVAGKFLGCWLACGLALVVFYLFLGVVSASHEHEFRLINYFQALWMHWMFLAVVIAMVLLGSIIFAAPSSNATIVIILVLGILLVGQHLGRLAIHQPEPQRTILYALYFIIPHLEFFDLQDFVVFKIGWVDWKYLALASLYALAYTAFFLCATWVCFRRKPLSQ
ncbi:MAG TPA: ABC transporter permease subunit [Verrucomicrobiae bacterium]|nr:ABC transporter permease subunit [Verrucomicrobiae bacterium]